MDYCELCENPLKVRMYPNNKCCHDLMENSCGSKSVLFIEVPAL